MGELETKLLMTFSTTGGNKMGLLVSDPREDITKEEIKEAMDIIIEKDIFDPKNGESLLEAIGAKIVQTEVTDYDLVVS